MSLTEQFGRRLRYWRKKRHLTQERLSDLLGWFGDPSPVSRMEHGKSNPTLATLERLLDALDVSIEEFFLEVKS